MFTIVHLYLLLGGTGYLVKSRVFCLFVCFVLFCLVFRPDLLVSYSDFRVLYVCAVCVRVYHLSML